MTREGKGRNRDAGQYKAAGAASRFAFRRVSHWRSSLLPLPVARRLFFRHCRTTVLGRHGSEPSARVVPSSFDEKPCVRRPR